MSNGYDQAIEDERRAAARPNPYDSGSGTWGKKKSNVFCILFSIILILIVVGLFVFATMLY